MNADVFDKWHGIFYMPILDGHIKDPVPLVKKSRASCPGGRFPPSFIHQVIIITGLNNIVTVCSHPEDGLSCWV